MEDDSSSIGAIGFDATREISGALPYLSRCVPLSPSSFPLCSMPRTRRKEEEGRAEGGLEGEPDRDDEDVVKRLYAPCLGSHTSKTKRRTVKGPRGVSPSDREANWYVRLRSLACFAPSPLPPLPSLALVRMIGCRTRRLVSKFLGRSLEDSHARAWMLFKLRSPCFRRDFAGESFWTFVIQ